MKRGIALAAARLLVLQGSMNYDRLQGIGTAVAIEPLIRDLHGGRNGKRYRAALGRNAGFFNTNPYLAGLAVGAVARAEHAGIPTRQLERFRSALKGPLGSLGDRLIWVGVLPASASMGIVCATLTSPLIAVAVFLGVFNVVHVIVRLWGLNAGWQSGVAVAQALKHSVLQIAVKLAGPLATFGVGVALPVSAVWLTTNLDPTARLGTAAVGLVTVVVTWWLVPSLGAARFGILTLAVALVLGWVI